MGQWRNSLALRIALVVIIAFVIWAMLAVGLFWRERAVDREHFHAFNTARRIANMSQLLNVAGRHESRRMVRAFSGPGLWLTIAGQITVEKNVSPWGNNLLKVVKESLGKAGEGALIVSDWKPIRKSRGGIRYRRILKRGMSHRRTVALALPRLVDGGESGHWIFVSFLPEPPKGWYLQIALLAVASFAVLLGVVVYSVSRLTRPLRDLADAAERLGRDVDAPPLPETGVIEARRAAIAYNEMQRSLQRLIRDRTMMLAAISHDLRSMLTRLRLRAEFIEGDEQRHKAITDLDHMEAMLAATLAFSRENSSGETMSDLDLANLLQDLVDAENDGGAKAGYVGPSHTIFNGQAINLRRALGNLVHNAVLHGGEVEVELRDENGTLAIDIMDRGPGLSDDLKERVFDPFVRGDANRQPGRGGMGLGLAIARSIIRKHGGDVDLIDRGGGGLIARVRLR